MIVEFKVKNFLSIKDEQKLSFEATADTHFSEIHCVPVTPKLKLLKIAAIFGANASGKSNILKALSFMHQMIVHSATQKQVFDQTGFIPFTFSGETLEAPGMFEITFILEDIRYTYGFTLDKYAVLEEWLFNYPKGKKNKLFSRKGTPKDHHAYDYDYQWGTSLKGEKKLLADLTRQNSLFLSVSGQFKHDLLNRILQWFKLKMKPLVTPHSDIFNFTSLKCKEDAVFKGDVLRLLKYADFKIDDILFEPIRFKDKDEDLLPPPKGETFLKAKLQDPIRDVGMEVSQIIFKHRVEEAGGPFLNNLEFSQESMGTQRYYELAGPLLDLIAGGGVLYIDELESSLHSQLLFHFIKTFLQNAQSGQIIFTSHDLQILTVELLRRDEIWFTQMKTDGQTELYSLSDFHPRKDKLIRNGYLNGAYGAVPILRSYFKESEHGEKTAPVATYIK